VVVCDEDKLMHHDLLLSSLDVVGRGGSDYHVKVSQDGLPLLEAPRHIFILMTRVTWRLSRFRPQSPIVLEHTLDLTLG
jgi:hypothetical protein